MSVPAEEHRAARHVDRPGEHLGQGRLARPGTADQRVRPAAREGQADVVQRRRAAGVGLAVPEGQVADLQVAVERRQRPRSAPAARPAAAARGSTRRARSAAPAPSG